MFSHHGIDTMTNSAAPHDGPDGVPLTAAPAVLRRCCTASATSCSGSTVTSTATGCSPATDPAGRTNGFWEVTSSSLMDWPSQARVLELADNGDGTLSVLCTMVDHDGVVQPDPEAERDGRWLAGMHRELAANEP